LKPECRVASKRASQLKWWRTIPGYYHGEVHVKRVQAWRRQHPGYCRQKGAAKACGPPDALQDLLTAQGFDNKGVKVFRNCLSEEISRPLQDLLLAQQYALVGVASMITGDALQEDIALVLTTCYERGQRIGGIVPWMQTQEVGHERARADNTATKAKHSTAVQLGGSPSGP
jgi:hypothetical protein